MTDKNFNVLRTLGWLIPILLGVFAVAAEEFTIPHASGIIAVGTAIATACNLIVENLRRQYNSTHDAIVTTKTESNVEYIDEEDPIDEEEF